uniref:Ras-GAP domain-containing protein n=1 Tax=Mucochytrium quahogii TaxID=96639 RepID=A0A7S2RUT3_9STRA|mmetsp:Transcript_7049/g.11196  ORF Transcript_7049/g.11196 Transcript_7049/m.11196 type:complete len:608 (-) Transcript_7049:1139-2962(-)|eukprot:CAMPEP_0203762986 /NCGR_PEP_ID=MMETSP0098-20131031/15732_1 /ASSEMBLY_ACC=CAM_ASM_000208 /TAXON_ID=96639 /ORGANISM=" , Strain NY0313808BC1" /LENGTH=607 /DNA_ID=CAMNT_0050657589 /DNA_START=561 /DNA_END=2384 /DNA_ORIENTATION=-
MSDNDSKGDSTTLVFCFDSGESLGCASGGGRLEDRQQAGERSADVFLVEDDAGLFALGRDLILDWYRLYDSTNSARGAGVDNPRSRLWKSRPGIYSSSFTSSSFFTLFSGFGRRNQTLKRTTSSGGSRMTRSSCNSSSADDDAASSTLSGGSNSAKMGSSASNSLSARGVENIRPTSVQEYSNSPVDRTKDRKLRSWFFSRKQKMEMLEREVARLLFLMMYYPQYPISMLTSTHQDMRELQKSLCKVYNTKLYSDRVMTPYAEVLFWHVLKNEFQSETCDGALRSNTSATFLLSGFVKEPHCKNSLLACIGPILEQIKNVAGCSDVTRAIVIAEQIVKALSVAIFPSAIYKLCTQLKILAGEEDAMVVVCSSFFFLRFVNPAILAYGQTHLKNEHNNVTKQVARLLQLLCKHVTKRRNKQGSVESSSGSSLVCAIASSKVTDEEAQDVDEFLARNTSAMKDFFVKLLDKGNLYNVNSTEEMNTVMLKKELVLDIGRCLDERLRDSSTQMSVYLSISEVKTLAKCALQQAKYDTTNLVYPISMRILEFAGDIKQSNEKQYIEVSPQWVSAPPMCEVHEFDVLHTFTSRSDNIEEVEHLLASVRDTLVA